MTGLRKHACLSPGAGQCSRRQGLRTDRCPCQCHDDNPHDERCRVTIGDGECNCALAGLKQAFGPVLDVVEIRRDYHRAAAGYRGPSLLWLSVKADVMNFLRKLLPW